MKKRIFLFLFALFIHPCLFSITLATNQLKAFQSRYEISLKDWQYKAGDSPRDSHGKFIWLNAPFTDSTWHKCQIPDHYPSNNKSHILWQRTIIPETSFVHPALYFHSVDQIFEIYLGKTLYYRYGDINEKFKRPFIGYTPYLIKLRKSDEGKTLSLRVYSKLDSIGIFNKASVVDYDRFFKQQFLKEFDSLMMSFFFIMIGLFITALFIFSDISVFNERPFFILVLGLLEIVIGIFTLTQTDLKSLIYYSPKFWTNMTIGSLFLFPVFGYLFYYLIIKDMHKKEFYIEWLWVIHLVFFVVAVILDFFNIVYLHEIISLFWYLIITTILLMGISIVRHLFKGNIEITLFLIGVLFILLFGGYDVLGNMKLVPWSRSFVHWGVFLFSTMMLIIFMIEFKNIVVKLSANEKEMEIASLVQQAVLPKTDTFKMFDSFETDVAYLPYSGTVGGDYYSLLPLKDGKAFVMLADASGHGIQAALSTMQMDVLIKESRKYPSLIERALYLNEMLLNNSKNFFTLFMAFIYENEMEYINAGHPAQYLIRRKSKEIIPLKSKGKPIGIINDPELDIEKITVLKGDLLLLFSDGLFEEFNAVNQELQEEGLVDFIQSILNHYHWNVDIKVLNKEIISKVIEYCGKRGLHDDVTLFSIKIIK